ncbi:oligopeptide transport system ATP-binding protein [Arboricoccus pini]|uniref:Oligopeptide transport system ATP-binding protein n=1 Tax=Arboricoccus pini TaxID=1963835 RepID=A0A212RW08_9PROT|nr:oligopeptide/dipeptide ABC transporter ATP-binding protein [Arboricoccus pini]SNB76772.1 oligopeptide transport system ATP-binding protein [Arboricoccus pini]
MDQPLLEIDHLSKHYAVGRSWLGRGGGLVRAVDDISFVIQKGEILGLVGESGSGKSTVGRMLLRLGDQPTAGRVDFAGQDIAPMSQRQLRPLRARMQLIFQDPYSSLNPKMTVGQILEAPLRIHGRGGDRAARQRKVAEVLDLVGLRPGHAARYPHEFSGGQRQRIGIARAIILEPDFLVADEAVSALDVSVQAQVVSLLLEIRRRMGVTILFIAHDLAVVGYISDRVAVMYLGRIVELAPVASLYARPRHPYSEALFSAAPVPDPRANRQRILLEGDVPSPLNPPSGCAFRTRCAYAIPGCAAARPPLAELAPGHFAACIRPELELRRG